MTGAGLVTSLGNTAPATWDRLMRGERGVGPVTLFDAADFRSSLAAEARGFEVPRSGGRAAGWCRTSALAWNAAREAIGVARLDVKTRRVGLVVGGTTGGMFENEAILAKLYGGMHAHDGQAPPLARRGERPPLSPQVNEVLADLLSHPLSSAADALHEALGPFARVRSLCSACSSGANALLVAALWLELGEVDAVVAGGTDGLCRLTFSGFNALQATDPGPCRPFDRRRRGLNLGEGAGFVVLEREGDARARGAHPIAELAGWAATAEAHHITNPEPTGEAASRTIARALALSGLSPADLDYVNAHGTGTPLNDAMESAALAHALGDDVKRVLVSSSKAQIGHTLGAAGAVEAIFAAFAVHRQEVPPTAGLDEPDPACALVHVPHVGRKARVRVASSNAFGFGGMDTVLVFAEPGREEGSRRRAPPPGLSGGGRVGGHAITEGGHAITEGGQASSPRDQLRAPRTVVITGAGALTAAGLDDASTAALHLLSGPIPEAATCGGPLADDVGARLDRTRARRLDRPARLGAVVCEHALAEAARTGAPLDPAGVGAVLGSAFGSVDPSAGFMHRLFAKGARLASPAEFPNLVPSSPVGHVSIYLGIHGPALATADLATTGESAVVQAAELVAMGEAEAVVAGAVEEASPIVEGVFVALFARSPGDGSAQRPPDARGEGAAAVVLEAEEGARARGATILARLAQSIAWRDAPSAEGGDGRTALDELTPPVAPGEARVVLARESADADGLLARSPWSSVPRVTCRERAGEHEALGAVALVVATSLLARGEAREVLVLGLARGRGYALVLAAP